VYRPRVNPAVSCTYTFGSRAKLGGSLCSLYASTPTSFPGYALPTSFATSLARPKTRSETLPSSGSDGPSGLSGMRGGSAWHVGVVGSPNLRPEPESEPARGIVPGERRHAHLGPLRHPRPTRRSRPRCPRPRPRSSAPPLSGGRPRPGDSRQPPGARATGRCSPRPGRRRRRRRGLGEEFGVLDDEPLPHLVPHAGPSREAGVRGVAGRGGVPGRRGEEGDGGERRVGRGEVAEPSCSCADRHFDFVVPDRGEHPRVGRPHRGPLPQLPDGDRA